ncbi:coiled-coil domain-containing protein [Streptomyces hirsutus]|uniref:hypothetical protein n=1 Tax=Streptomyces hirsutus TaxID=35620 RepID=UPI00364B59A6
MNVARPGRPLGPVSGGLQPPVEEWVQAFRTTVVERLLGGDDPLTLEQVSVWLTARAPHTVQQKAGAAGADRLQSVHSGRGATSVQRMVSGRLVPTRDVVLDLLQLLQDRGCRPDAEALEELWQLHRPALRSRRPDVAEAYDIIDERDAAQTEAAGLRRQVDVLEAEQRRALLDLTRTGLQLLGTHRALAASQKELHDAIDSVASARAKEQQARLHLEAAVDRLDRLKDAYEQMREQAATVQQEAVADRAQWQKRQAALLERLSEAGKALAQAVQNAQDARQELADERRAGEAARRTAQQGQQADLRQADAMTTSQEAASGKDRRQEETAAAHRSLHDAELRHAQAMNVIARLETELRQARTRLQHAQQRLIRADAPLVSMMLGPAGTPGLTPELDEWAPTVVQGWPRNEPAFRGGPLNDQTRHGYLRALRDARVEVLQELKKARRDLKAPLLVRGTAKTLTWLLQHTGDGRWQTITENLTLLHDPQKPFVPTSIPGQMSPALATHPPSAELTEDAVNTYRTCCAQVRSDIRTLAGICAGRPLLPKDT